MKYKIDERLSGVVLKLLPESHKEEILLQQMEDALDGIFGRLNYVLEPIGKEKDDKRDLVGLGYLVSRKNPEK